VTDEQINAEIAKACGWRDLTIESGSGFYKGFDNGAELRPDLPDYVNDLNAMHEAEKVLSLQQEKDYFANIKEIVGDNIWYRTVGKTYRATARQRAEAFLWAIDKWKGAAE
jgi:hypothetical protein